MNWGNAPDISWPNYERFSSYFFISGTQPFLPEDGPTSIQRWPDGHDTDQGSDWKVITRSPGTFSCSDPYESDDTLATALDQQVGTTNEHRICAAGDNDYIGITMSSNYTYTLQAIAVGSHVDLATRLYDSGGDILVDDNPAGTRNSTIVFRPASNARFEVQVYDANASGGSGPDWLYNFTITQQVIPTATPTPATSVTPTPIGCNDAYEPDDNIAQAKNSTSTRSKCTLSVRAAPHRRTWTSALRRQRRQGLYTVYERPQRARRYDYHSL